MAYFQRLIFAALVALVMWVPCSSYASFAATSDQVFTYTRISPAITSATCAGIGGSGYDVSNGGTTTITSASLNSAGTCDVRYTSSLGWLYGGSDIAVVSNKLSCPSGSTLTGSSCTCSTGFVESGSSCVNSGAAADANTLAALQQAGCTSLGSSAPNLNVCIGGRSFHGGFSAAGAPGFSSYTCGPWSAAGTSCTASPVTPGIFGNSVDGGACPKGQSQGTVNGLVVCAPVSSTNVISSGKSGSITPASSPAPATANPTSGTDSPKLTNDAPASATNYNDQTTCNNGTCTTTRTFTDATGQPAGTKFTTDTQASFCAQNPGLSICTQSSFSAAPCGSPPTCSGDAVQCATARYVFETTCALQKPDSSPEIDAFEAAKLTSGGDQTAKAEGNLAFNFSANSFDQTELLGSASGISDLTVSIMGRPLVLNFSLLNVWLARLGLLLQAITFLLCARIVIRG